MKVILRTCSALVALAVAMQSTLSVAEAATATVTTQPSPGADVLPYFNDPSQDPSLSTAQLLTALRKKVKYVFVIFHENRSFDSQYGTFPGANGLYSDGQNPRSAANTTGFTQTYTDSTGATVSVQPFLIGPSQNATAIDSVDHSHTGLAAKIDVVNNVAQMDKFAYDEYNRFASKGGSANIAEGKQFARLVMSHVDCNTVPLYWQWASHFALFDNIFATEDTPSSPNAIAMIAGQAGETQWVEHGNTGTTVTVGTNTGTLNPPPMYNDPQPFWGSQFDTTTTNKQPAGTNESYSNSNISANLTFASLPLTFMGRNATTLTAQDLAPATDLADVKDDVPFITANNSNQVNWAWYQEGYDLEATDTTSTASHASFISHHQGPQYFGYVANNPTQTPHLKGLTDFFSDISNNNLPSGGGVFYLRGGYTNIAGLKTPIQNANYPNTAGLTTAEITKVQNAYLGDDDHPAYSDNQISEALAARTINAVASNPTLWAQSAIVITYDESDGFYDHVAPRVLSYGPDMLPLSRGIRIPLMVISPYARTHVVSHVEGDHNAVIQTINAIFNLPALASLPDEAAALVQGMNAKFNGPNGFVQQYLGPRDINSAISGNLLSAFDPRRLVGLSAPLPASLAIVPTSVVNTLPTYSGKGCSAIGITPEDQRQGLTNTVPAGFNTLPSTLPAYN
ncbi:MAG: alkaline phosphatase family protein [Azospirillaceae bacterium]|nr:alkaline phosphatase family protein [Azospirillaceae bacterium]